MKVRTVKWLETSSCEHRQSKRKQSQETHDFIPWFGQVTLAYFPRCGVPMDEGCTQTLSSDPMINLNTTTFLAFLAFLFFQFARNLHKLESLALTTKDHNEHTRVRLGVTHTNPQNTHAHKPILELKMKHKEFTTRTELKSLTRSIKCAETECRSLRMLSECLGDSSMRLGVPFIAPR
jgi:hypothetical protein